MSTLDCGIITPQRSQIGMQRLSVQPAEKTNKKDTQIGTPSFTPFTSEAACYMTRSVMVLTDLLPPTFCLYPINSIHRYRTPGLGFPGIVAKSCTPTPAKGQTHTVSASIAGAVGTSISVWAHDMARGLLDDGVPAGVNAVAA